MFLFFDTETTGLPRNWNAPVTELENWPRLVQLAWLLYDRDGNRLDGCEHIIKPEGFSVPEESARVHGITTEKAMMDGENLQKVLEEFSEKMGKSEILVAHNMSFDEKIIGAEFLRNNIKNDLFDKERICTMLSSIEFCQIPSQNGKGYKWPRLSELHIKLFGEDFADAHDALVDTDACARCFFELCKREIIEVPEMEISEMKKNDSKVSKQGSLF
ncbi:MAG: 3'-5' exonuclease [Candidatus Paceibacterota bacterium]